MSAPITTHKFEATDLEPKPVKWEYATCPYCGEKYRFPQNISYRPKTCIKYQCIRRSLHANLASKY